MTDLTDDAVRSLADLAAKARAWEISKGQLPPRLYGDFCEAADPTTVAALCAEVLTLREALTEGSP